jgi:hypothetical protein
MGVRFTRFIPDGAGSWSIPMKVLVSLTWTEALRISEDVHRAIVGSYGTSPDVRLVEAGSARESCYAEAVLVAS